MKCEVIWPEVLEYLMMAGYDISNASLKNPAVVDIYRRALVPFNTIKSDINAYIFMFSVGDFFNYHLDLVKLSSLLEEAGIIFLRKEERPNE